jgi:hypothetical protein
MDMNSLLEMEVAELRKLAEQRGLSVTGNKQNGSDGQDLFHYDPQAGWKHMTNQEYQGYNNPASFYQDPNQYAAQAGGNRNEYEMRNGMWQTQLGTGTYR